MFVGVIMYADDLILLSASVHGLQQMLNCCSTESDASLLQFNYKKCTASVVGHARRFKIDKLALGQNCIDWCTSFKYLGVTFVAGKKLVVDVNTIKRKFYASCNAILCATKCLNEIVKLSLVETYCLPILMYATAALDLRQEQLNELNCGWNSMYRRIFGFQKWESVRIFIAGLGRLDFKCLRAYACLKFVKFGFASTNEIFRNLVKRFVVSNDFRKLCSSVNLPSQSVDYLLKVSNNRLQNDIATSFSTAQ